MRARDNPFRTDRVLGVRYKLEHGSWPELLSRLERLRYRAALVGAHGCGKTTLLEDLEPFLIARGFCPRPVRFDTTRPSFERGVLRQFLAQLGREDVILFDGAEQLGGLAWREFRFRSRKAGGLIITTHRPGRLPTAWTCRTSPGLLEAIVNELLGNVAMRRPLASELWDRHSGDIRAALRELYDRWVLGSALS